MEQSTEPPMIREYETMPELELRRLKDDPMAQRELQSRRTARERQQAQTQLSLQLKTITAKEEQPYTLHLSGLFNSSEPPLPDLPTVAAALCMSERTLNRRLQQEGSSFRALKTM